MGIEAKSGGLDRIAADLIKVGEVLRDPKPTLDQVVEPRMREHAARMLETAGRHGGQSWALAPKYRAYKAAVTSKRLASRPLLWTEDAARLAPSLTRRTHPDAITRYDGDELVLGSRVPYANRLLVTGGVGPFGEPYPARNPWQMTAQQERELAEAIDAHTRKRLSRYLTTAKMI